MKDHILVVSQYFYPEDFRINDICREWVKRGHEVTVVTGIPNYPQGRFFKGYGWFKKRYEVHEGIRIIRVPILPRGKGAVMLALNYLSFVVSGFFWKIFTRVEADKVFIFEVSPMTQALVGVWYAKKRKIPCCIYVQDLWPENVEIVTGLRNRRLIRAIDRMVDYIYRSCDKIFAASPGFVRRIEERGSAKNASGSKVVYWPQYAEEFYRPAPRRPLADMPGNGEFKVAFTGNIGYAQGLDILPRTAGVLMEKNVKCLFVIIGDGRYREELEQQITEKHVEDYFLLLGRKRPEEVPDYLAWCDAAFLSFADNPLFGMTIPAKLQSYMACGMPVLAAAGGETARIIKEAGCGVVCGFGNADGVAEAVEALSNDRGRLKEMAENAVFYNQKHFDKTQLMDKAEELMGGQP